MCGGCTLYFHVFVHLISLPDQPVDTKIYTLRLLLGIPVYLSERDATTEDKAGKTIFHF